MVVVLAPMRTVQSLREAERTLQTLSYSVPDSANVWLTCKQHKTVCRCALPQMQTWFVNETFKAQPHLSRRLDSCLGF